MASSFTVTPHTFLTNPLYQSHSKTPPPSLSTTPADPLRLETSTRPSNVDSTVWVASSMSRRFGLGAGLAWAGFLAFRAVSQEIKTGLEVSQEQGYTWDFEEQQEIVLPNGIRYYEMRAGVGASPGPDDLVVINLKGIIKDSGEVFVDTFGGNKRSVALVLGSRPYTRGMCDGIEYVLRTMKTGGKRRVIVPPQLGFGQNGVDFGFDAQVPPNATLEYIVEAGNVSMAPA